MCYYGAGIHDGKLGRDADAGSLARAKEIRDELLMIFGTNDPHVPGAGRETIDRTLQSSAVRYKTLLYPAAFYDLRGKHIRKSSKSQLKSVAIEDLPKPKRSSAEASTLN